MTMCKFPFPRIHGPNDNLCIRSITTRKFDCVVGVWRF